jgi:hypothetical protein
MSSGLWIACHPGARCPMTGRGPRAGQCRRLHQGGGNCARQQAGQRLRDLRRADRRRTGHAGRLWRRAAHEAHLTSTLIQIIGGTFTERGQGRISDRTPARPAGARLLLATITFGKQAVDQRQDIGGEPVRISPGTTVSTRIPTGRNSAWRPSEKPTAANFAVEYGTRCGTLTFPPIEVMLTMWRLAVRVCSGARPKSGTPCPGA